jgi:hypothetical protein
MNLGEIRQKFLQVSGRTDLGNGNSLGIVDSKYSIAKFEAPVKFNSPIAGADFYINTAQKYLDNRIELQELKMLIVDELRVKESTFILPNVIRYFVQVLWNDKVLERTNFDMRMLQQSTGVPYYWCISPMRTFGNKEKFLDFVERKKLLTDVFAFQDFNKDGNGCTCVKISPSPSDSGMLSILAQAYSKPLVKDDDESIWSIKYPDLLVTTALYYLEKDYRNTEGAKDYNAAIEREISVINWNDAMNNQGILGEIYEKF